MKHIIKLTMAAWLFAGLASCDFLDVMPDNIPTIDHAFKSRTEAEKYLVTCYSYLPPVGNVNNNPAHLGGDEIWGDDRRLGLNDGGSYAIRRIALGEQGTQEPIADYFNSAQTGNNLHYGLPLFTGLSECNIFLENIHRPYDLEDWEREQWVAEVKFLKAFYHFWLFRMYGPIPLIKENISVSETGASQRYREPVDDVVEYIVSLCDEVAEVLPLVVENPMRDLGRPTRVMALTLKAQALTYAASPLFNCNADYADYKDNRGVVLFPQDKTQEKPKWQRAADALKAAIDAAHEANIALYDFRTGPRSATYAPLLSEETILAQTVRGAATEPWNQELIWGDVSTGSNRIQDLCFPALTATHHSGRPDTYSPPLRIVEQFYTKNGIPIEEDASWTTIDPFSFRVATADERQYIKQGNTTIALHFDREPRFYGSIIFDNGTLYGNLNPGLDNTANPNNMAVTTQTTTFFSATVNHAITGYLCKKMLHFLSSVADNSNSMSYCRYPFPVVRLADLYLMYAEALNEVKDAPDATVYEYIDAVRARTGLKGVVESWNSYAIASKRNKPSTQEGMREIIQRERMIELAFEGVRFWDLRRWKLAKKYLNMPIRGLSMQPQADAGKNIADFYTVKVINTPKFEDRDYFWPIRVSTLLRNQNLIQSPGW